MPLSWVLTQVCAGPEGFPGATSCPGLGGLVGTAASTTLGCWAWLGLDWFSTCNPLYVKGTAASSLPRWDGAEKPCLTSPDRAWGLGPARLVSEPQQCLFPAE